MNRLARTFTLLALALAPTTVALDLGHAMSANPATPTQALRVRQSHGMVTRPANPTGWLVNVRGAPGTSYEVYLTSPGGAPDLFASGTIPSGGSWTQAVFLPGATPQPHTETVEVTSRATGRVAVLVEYD